MKNELRYRGYLYAYGEAPDAKCFNGLSNGIRKKTDVEAACKLMVGKRIIGVQICNDKPFGEIGTNAFIIYLEDENRHRWELFIQGVADDRLNFPELFTSIAEFNDKDKFETFRIMED